jgi:3,4-dihydroxy 2-butanone 4-phosphate synthase/GTP cyclohydrolase II
MSAITHVGQVRQIYCTRLPTRWGVFETRGFERQVVNGRRRTETAVAIILGDVTEGAPLVRIHSQCFTGELLGSLRCDCNDQLQIAMQAIGSEGRGIVIYEHEEGRGIGLTAKFQAYALQDAGLDTIDANQALGFDADYRTFGLPAAILQHLGIRCVRLMTNNPRKLRALQAAGIEVAARVPCEVVPTRHSQGYLTTKKERMGHLLSLELAEPGRVQVRDRGAEIETAGGNGTAPTGNDSPFASIDDALHALRAGRMIVVVDDEDRENEGDLTMAAEMITPEAVNFMARYGRGLICLAMTGERLDELDLAPMTNDNTALGGTAFTVSIDVQGRGVTTGISAYDRAQTIKAAVEAETRPEDFARPGHVFPLRARSGGVLERRGQTEAAVDLAGLAGLFPAGVICEIVNDDGSMARVPDLVGFCRTHGLLMVTVADLARYRLDSECEQNVGLIDGLFSNLG